MVIVCNLELMNERFAGDVFKDPLLMLPGVADLKNLQPFYDGIAPSIHEFVDIPITAKAHLSLLME